MSLQIVRNHEGVLLRYGDSDKPQRRQSTASDLERIAIIKAEREIKTLATIAEHLEVSTIGVARIFEALITIQRALELLRIKLIEAPNAAQ